MKIHYCFGPMTVPQACEGSWKPWSLWICSLTTAETRLLSHSLGCWVPAHCPVFPNNQFLVVFGTWGWGVVLFACLLWPFMLKAFTKWLIYLKVFFYLSVRHYNGIGSFLCGKILWNCGFPLTISFGLLNICIFSAHPLDQFAKITMFCLWLWNYPRLLAFWKGAGGKGLQISRFSV